MFTSFYTMMETGKRGRAAGESDEAISYLSIVKTSCTFAELAANLPSLILGTPTSSHSSTSTLATKISTGRGEVATTTTLVPLRIPPDSPRLERASPVPQTERPRTGGRAAWRAPTERGGTAPGTLGREGRRRAWPLVFTTKRGGAKSG